MRLSRSYRFGLSLAEDERSDWDGRGSDRDFAALAGAGEALRT
jgi:hypothetical protein